MLDIKFIRNYPNLVKEGCRKKQVNVDIDKLLEVDKKRREVLKALENILAQKNKASKEISQIKNDKEKKRIISKMKELDQNSDRLNKELKLLTEEFNNLMFQIPNLPLNGVPVGKDERDNVVLKEVAASGEPRPAERGEKPRIDFKPKDYLEIAQNLDLIDIQRAAKVSGSRFGYLKKEAALLEFALINLALDILTEKEFAAVIPPVMIKLEMMGGMGYIKGNVKSNEWIGKEVYFLRDDPLVLVGTSEQSIGPMHTNEIFEEKDLPKRYVGFSTCFRREAGAYGKDTKGILRVHQFDKVEMFSFCHPEKSKEEHLFLLSMEEKLMQLLEIPYRVVNICTGDLGVPAAAKYDIEAWMPSQGQYRETHSTSNCTDFQARRLNVRYRDKTGKLNFVHTLNGTALAIGRILIAIIENYQQKDGSIRVPEVLQKYLPFKIIKR